MNHDETADAADAVGPVLQAGAMARAIITAIRSLNDSVEVIDRGGYLRVLVPGRCVVTRQALEEALGGPSCLPRDLEAVMSSYRGSFTVSEDLARWEARRAARGGDASCR